MYLLKNSDGLRRANVELLEEINRERNEHQVGILGRRSVLLVESFEKSRDTVLLQAKHQRTFEEEEGAVAEAEGEGETKSSCRQNVGEGDATNGTHDVGRGSLNNRDVRSAFVKVGSLRKSTVSFQTSFDREARRRDDVRCRGQSCNTR